MLSSLVALAMMMQSDTTRGPREAFTTCLRQFVEQSMRDRKTAEQFRTEFAAACTAQQTSFRDAIIRRETAARASRSTAEQSARLEIEDVRTNFADRFEPPR